MGESVAFDRAAEYYDQTRGISADSMRQTIELLAGELAGRGSVLEVGVGTGQLALPLHEAGVAVAGLDLARPMMDKLVEKAGGRLPFALVQGDATRMPLRDRAFGGAYLRWVLHLISPWRDALAEMVRVVQPGGVLVASLGGYGGPRSEVQERFAELTGVSIEPPGLTWDGYEELDAAAIALGLVPRALPPIPEIGREGLDTFIDGIAKNAYSWTWKIEDPTLLARTAVDVRRWAEERYGSLEALPHDEYQTHWRAYDLPADR
ncbi:MAG: class I SAM-dependent methyltransferase [Actinomycetota bacterium]